MLARLLIWQGTLVAFNQGRPYLNQGLSLLGQPAPATNVGLQFGLAVQIWQQLLYRLWPGWSVGRLASRRATLLAAARGCERLMAACYFANDTMPTLYAVFRSLNLAEAAGLSPELARGYASVGMMIGLIPLHKIAEAYFGRALAASQAVEDLSVQIWVSLVTGVYFGGVGSWARAEELLQQSIGLAEQMGDRYRWDDGVGNLAAVAYFQGNFAASLELSDDFYRSASDRRDAHNQGWALRGKVYGLLPQGKFSEALACLEELGVLLAADPHMDEALKIDRHGLLALVHIRRKKPDLALAAAEEAIKLMIGVRPALFLSLPGYAGVAETYLRLWEAKTIAQPSASINPKVMPASSDSNVKDLKSGAWQACGALRSYARVFPIGQPQACLWRGTYQWLSGRANAARKLWAASLNVAGALAMPYDQGLIHYEIGKHCPAGDPARASHLTMACDIFERLKASYDLARAQEALRFENQVGRRCSAGGLFNNSAAKPKL